MTVPDSDGRYLSVTPINRDGDVNAVFYDAGDYELSTDQFETDYLLLPVRMLTDPNDREDVAAASALQDQTKVSARSAWPFDLIAPRLLRRVSI